MATNYLQYIGSVNKNQNIFPYVRFLVSGVDDEVKRIVGENIISSAFSRGLPLFIIDNTRQAAGYLTNFSGYRVANILDGGVSICKDILEVDSLMSISRLRSFLSDLGFDSTKSMQIVTYLKFVKETERRLGNTAPLTLGILEEYGGNVLVKSKLGELVACGRLTEDNYQYLLGRYSEISGAAADFETFLVLLEPFVGNTAVTAETALHIPVGEFGSDKPMQDLFCKVLLSHIKKDPTGCAVLILDDGIGTRGYITDLLKDLPSSTEVHMISNDVFSLPEGDRSTVMNKFPAKIYTRHEDMSSCGKIETLCGDIDVVRHTSTVTVDRRLRANSAWDMLFGTNKSETDITNAPVREPRYRKERIQTLSPRTGIVDYAGEKIIFSF